MCAHMETSSPLSLGSQKVETSPHKEEFRKFFFRNLTSLQEKPWVEQPPSIQETLDSNPSTGGGERKLLIWGCFDHTLGGRNVSQLVE